MRISQRLVSRISEMSSDEKLHLLAVTMTSLKENQEIENSELDAVIALLKPSAGGMRIAVLACASSSIQEGLFG
jgi:hypothetical protein